jgi:hypothetical protein
LRPQVQLVLQPGLELVLVLVLAQELEPRLQELEPRLQELEPRLQELEQRQWLMLPGWRSSA